MPSAFDELLDDLAAFQRARGSGGGLQKSFSKPASGFDMERFRESERRAKAKSSRIGTELDQAMKSFMAFAAEAPAKRPAGPLPLLKARFAELNERLSVEGLTEAVRAGQMTAHEVAKLEIDMNRIGAHLAAIEQAGAA
jgi:hypothetical protein